MTALVALLCACPGDSESAGCDNDSECKGDRLCVDGTCQAPGGDDGSAGDDGGSTGSDSGGDGSGNPTTGADTTDGSTTGPVEQPYGVCVLECDTMADCCSEFSCDGGTTYECNNGLCQGQCVPGNCGPIGSANFECVDALLFVPGASFCGASCDMNVCSDVINDRAFYCNPDAPFEPQVCGFDCRVPGQACNGDNGSECLVTGTCGCINDGHCRPGFTCFKFWE